MEKVLVFYGEIGIKGKNKSDFVKKLKSNILKSSKNENLDIVSYKNEGASLLFEIKSKRENIINCFSNILGIKHFSFVEEIKTDVEILENKFNEICKLFKEKNIKIIYPKTKRAYKEFKLDSPQINNKLREIAKKYEIEVDYKNQNNMIYIRINFKSIFISFEKINGLGGLPVGSSGRVLVLLSGGIDSPVCAYNLMKRGCTCDFLHLHNLKSNQEVLNSKIVKTIKKLNRYQYKSTLYTLPYDTFEFSIIGKVIPRYELVIFKYYLLKLADIFAKEFNYLAIANGDNLAQVASQTLENLNVVNYNIELPIFRPLLTYEKEEIINIARKIDTFNLSIQTYKDCCSLVAKNPMTKAKFEKFIKSIENLNMDKLIKNSINNINLYKI